MSGPQRLLSWYSGKGEEEVARSVGTIMTQSWQSQRAVLRKSLRQEPGHVAQKHGRLWGLSQSYFAWAFFSLADGT